jgi:hypothetical protein
MEALNSLAEGIIAKSDDHKKRDVIIETTVKIIMGLKDIIAQGVESSPEASVVWAGVSVMLPVCSYTAVDLFSPQHFHPAISR